MVILVGYQQNDKWCSWLDDVHVDDYINSTFLSFLNTYCGVLDADKIVTFFKELTFLRYIFRFLFTNPIHIP